MCLVSVITVSCVQYSKITVSNAYDVVDFSEYSYIYYLPGTRMTVKVIAIKETVIPGPYCDYAEKYFGTTDNVIWDKSVQWRIKDLELNTMSEPDPDYFYVVNDNSGYLLNKELLKFSEYGMLYFPEYMNIKTTGMASAISATDLSVNHMKTSGIDTTTLLVFSGSGFSGVPKMKKEWEMKKEEEKAEEAAKFLIKLHKRKFKLITGQTDSPLSGEALKSALEELNHMEKEYMSLFFGRRIIEEYEKAYTFVPQQEKGYSRFVIFRFSEQEGFLDADEIKGIPAIIELSSRNTLTAIQNIKRPASLDAENVLYYRIPEYVDYIIIYNTEEISKGITQMYQFGTIIPYFIR